MSADKTSSAGREAWLVTIKLPKRPHHNPKNKVTAPCAVSSECTDETGEHHTAVAYSAEEIEEFRAVFGHITRVERIGLRPDVHGQERDRELHG